MAGWLVNRLRAGRYSMTLQLLKADLSGASAQHHAAVIVEAAAMLTKLQADDFVMGTLLERAAFELGTSSQDAESLYDALEDVLSAAEAQRKQIAKHAKERLGAEAAQSMNRRAQVQGQGLRLLLVALARRADESFKAKARVLREGLYGAKDAIPAVVADLQREDQLTNSLGLNAQEKDYENIQLKAERIGMSFLGW